MSHFRTTKGNITLTSASNYRLLNMIGMSTKHGQSGGPVWSEQFDRYENQYMVVGINSYGTVTNTGTCISNFATYMGPAQTIELQWHVSQLFLGLNPSGPVLVRPLVSKQYPTADVVSDALARNPNPQVTRGLYNGNPQASELYLFAKIVTPSDPTAGTLPLWSVVSTTYMTPGANPKAAGWASLASAPGVPGQAKQVCLNGKYANGCGMLVLTQATDQSFNVPATINIQQFEQSNGVIALQFLYQQPVVWASMPPAPLNPDLQITQGTSELWQTALPLF